MISTKKILENLTLNQKCNTYIISNEELNEINDKIHIKESRHSKLNLKEYRAYQSYRRSNIKRIMNSYNSSKAKDKKGKLTKEQFMMMYMDSIRKRLNKNNKNKLNNSIGKEIIF